MSPLVKVSIRRRALMTNGALVVLLLGGAGLVYAQLGTGRAESGPVVRTVTATRDSVTATVTASGSVESARSRSLSFAADGTVEKIYVKAGDKVAKGDILAKLDDDAVQEALTAAKATLDSAEADGTGTAQLYAAYVKARNAYRDAQRTVQGTVLKAPFAGTVITVNGSVGGTGQAAKQAANQNAKQGQATGQASSGSGGFIELADTSRLRLVGSFTESDVAKLEQGQHATVTFDALPGVTASGEVTQIDPVASTSDNVVQYPVTVTLSKVPRQVRLGQTATVEVVVGQADDVVTVPSTAISTSGGRTTVTLLKDGRQVPTPVEVGVRGTRLTEITSGVSEGDRIVPPAVTSGADTGGILGRIGGGGGGFRGGGGGGGGFRGGGAQGGRP
ncbi:efflux RND transporter periplasmic adaptor subunit [Nonomuraea maritima]|uniref:efflux RND transporter periplasmic adaptor subunit n=1 Tax=Nonomuraea maritima TaxID=683260 RepID=UPI00371F248D